MRYNKRKKRYDNDHVVLVCVCFEARGYSNLFDIATLYFDLLCMKSKFITYLQCIRITHCCISQWLLQSSQLKNDTHKIT